MNSGVIISPSLSPNTDWSDVWTAARVLMRPHHWMRGSEGGRVSEWFRRYLGTRNVVTVNSGRSALFLVLKAFGIGRGHEVLCQAFTCVAVPNAVLWTGARPVYVDIDNTLNMDPDAAEVKITRNTRAIIVQHTFGVPAAMKRLKEIAHKNNLIVIEDCAHSLGATVDGHRVGTIGDAAIFSFGRDKVISSVFGGLAVISDRNKKAFEELRAMHASLPYPPPFWVMQQILHPILFSIVLPLYRVGVGKVLLFLFQRLGLLGFPVYAKEKKGQRPGIFPARYPNALAMLLVSQLAKVDRMNAMRVANAQKYRAFFAQHRIGLPAFPTGTIYLRFPAFVRDPLRVTEKAKARGVMLGNWYRNIIDPRGTDFASVGYKRGSCPNAEKAAAHIINVPTRISDRHLSRVLDAIK